MLEDALNRLGPQRVVPSSYVERAPETQVAREQVLDRMDYRVRVDLGSLDYRNASQGLRVGSVVPLVNEVGADAIIKVNGTPLLVGSVGEVQGRYAVKVTGAYVRRRQPLLRDPGAFKPIRWPRASAE